MEYVILLISLAGIVFGADFLDEGVLLLLGFIGYTWYLISNQIA